MSDQTWQPSAQGREGSGEDLLPEWPEAEGVRKQVEDLNSDHVAGSCCSFRGELLQIDLASGLDSGELLVWAWILEGGKMFSESSASAFLLRLCFPLFDLGCKPKFSLKEIQKLNFINLPGNLICGRLSGLLLGLGVDIFLAEEALTRHHSAFEVKKCGRSSRAEFRTLHLYLPIKNYSSTCWRFFLAVLAEKLDSFSRSASLIKKIFYPRKHHLSSHSRLWKTLFSFFDFFVDTRLKSEWTEKNSLFHLCTRHRNAIIIIEKYCAGK